MIPTAITAATRIAGVIGHPVGHSLSPALHNAGFASLQIDWAYAAFDVPPGSVSDALRAMRTLGIGGLSVTMPHKEAAAEAVDELDPSAAALHSVNTVVALPDGRLVGHSTDGDGFVASLADAGVPTVGVSVCVLGAGGAARSIVEALARHGVASIVVVNRSAAGATRAAALAGPLGATHQLGSQRAAQAIRDAALVVNATSVGMGSAELPIDPALLHRGQVVADIVYHPRHTALLGAAHAAGARTVEGLGMLVHQAALQQRLWTGRSPDVAAMAAAAEHELALRQQHPDE
ncbi:MAG: shikimate dehydrogenase [Ilumatobacteraceae bacterium]